MIMSRITDSEPQEGFFKRRMIKGGPWVPVRIWWHTAERDEAGDLLEDEGWRCEFLGEPADAYEQWVRLMPAPYEIDEDEYRYLLRLRSWARTHARDDAYADPRKPVDLNKMKPFF